MTTQSPPSRPSTAGSISRFRTGLRVPLDGLSHMNRHPKLWRFAVIPILLNLLVTALVVLLLIGIAVWFVRWMHPRFPDGWWGVLLEIAAVLAVIAVGLLLALGSWVLLNGILCGHFYAKLSREVELQLGTPPEHLRDVPFTYQVMDAFRDTAALLAINVGLLALNIVPVLGSVVGLTLTVYLDAFIFGRDYLDFPMSLRGMRRADKLAIARSHRPETVGLGTSVFLLNLIPVLGSIGLATAATGSVLLFKQWRDAGDVVFAPAPPVTSA